MNSSYDDEFRNKCVLFLEKEINSPYSRNIEKSIFNYTLATARKNNIYCSWNTNKFKKLYLSKLRSIYSNIKSDTAKIKSPKIDEVDISFGTTFIDIIFIINGSKSIS